MNENINLCEILKDCPKGTKLYSTTLGYVIFQGILAGAVYPIIVTCENGVSSDAVYIILFYNQFKRQ